MRNYKGEYLTGVFLREGKTRFVAWVEIEGKRRKCYVPMSTKLSRYFDPVGCEVRLQKKGNRLWLEQVKCGRCWVWVNAAKAPELLCKQLERRGLLVEKERTVSGYRFDLYADDVGYEVKSVLSDQREIHYPNAPSSRRQSQLQRISKLVKRGQKAEWVIVSLSPLVQKIMISKDSEGKRLKAAVEKGMKLRAYRCSGKGGLVNCEVEL